MLYEELLERKLPDYLTFLDGTKVESVDDWEQRKIEIKELLCKNFAGYSPHFATRVKGVTKKVDANSLAGKATHSLVDIQLKTFNKYFSFPCNLIVPKDVENPPVFLYISFSPHLCDEYLPLEEIIDNGFAVASFYYQDVAPDRDDGFTNGVGLLATRNPFDSWGKISMWGWAASRVMDYLQTLDNIDKNRIAVMGHSRLGKTALWCGANDNRFSMVISNNSGAGGAALFRGKVGEKISDLVKTPWHWFCGNFKQYADSEDGLPFDQHFLMAMIAPRYLYVCSAQEDEWADPKSEFLGCLATSKAYNLYGLDGLVSENHYPEVDTVLHSGHIGYHMRKGAHFLSRYDWQKIMEFRNKNECK